MSGGPACACPERSFPIERRRWLIIDYKCNHSAFNGYRETPSDYSKVQCTECGRVWSTKAAYVDDLEMGTLKGLK